MLPSAALLMDRCRDRPQGTTALDSFREKEINKSFALSYGSFQLACFNVGDFAFLLSKFNTEILAVD